MPLVWILFSWLPLLLLLWISLVGTRALPGASLVGLRREGFENDDEEGLEVDPVSIQKPTTSPPSNTTTPPSSTTAPPSNTATPPTTGGLPVMQAAPIIQYQLPPEVTTVAPTTAVQPTAPQPTAPPTPPTMMTAPAAAATTAPPTAATTAELEQRLAEQTAMASQLQLQATRLIKANATTLELLRGNVSSLAPAPYR